MSTTLRPTVSVRNAMLDALRTQLDIDVGAGTVKIYTGTIPATGDTAIGAQVLLGTLTLTDPAAPAAAAGVLTLSAITEDSIADATGTATWARVQSASTASGFDCSVGATGSGEVIELNTTSIVAGGPIRITAFTITAPQT